MHRRRPDIYNPGASDKLPPRLARPALTSMRNLGIVSVLLRLSGQITGRSIPDTRSEHFLDVAFNLGLADYAVHERANTSIWGDVISGG